MRSVTSCFNSTLYRKTMARFWPLWALYGVLWLFLVPLLLLNEYFDVLRYDTVAVAQGQLLRMAEDLPELLQGGVWLSCFVGVLAAMAVFGYLYNNRSAGMMHGLPLRRDTLFLTQYLAGLSFLLLPLLVSGVLTAAVELLLLPAAHWSQALSMLGILLLGQSGTTLFFFSFAAFCAMFTGHVLALPAFYGILNALVSVIYYLITALMEAIFYGYPGFEGDNGLVMLLTPVWALFEACQWNIKYVEAASPYGGVTSEIERRYLESPEMILGYAVAGLVLTGLALLVYRRRQVESAGDVVSVPVVRPIFRCGVAFCVGLCFGVYTAAFFGWQNSTLFLSLAVVAWTAVGYFAAEMLLKKSFRVFQAWKGCLVMTAAVALLCTACFHDWFGVEDRVPSVNQVSVVNVTSGMGYPSDDGSFEMIGVSDPDQIQRAIDLHQAIVNDKDRADYNSPAYEPGDDYISYRITYTLKDGSTLSRRYYSVPVYCDELNQEGSLTWQANELIQDRELTANCYNFAYYDGLRIVDGWLDNVLRNEYAYYDSIFFDGASGEDLEELWQAVKADFAEGTIGVRYLFDSRERRTNTYYTDLTLSFERTPEQQSADGKTYTQSYASSSTFTITLTPSAKNTLAWLEYHNVLGDQYQLAKHEQ